MAKATQPPWSAGPGEILKHGLDLLRKDSDTNRRLAMISIDNAVELMMKTYLGLPRRVTALNISRSQYQEFSESFPKLLDALEKFASDKLDGIDLGEIEWYHRLRNQLYHQGNGLTVERDKVEVYAELANVLFTNLFGFQLVEPEDDGTTILGTFMLTWTDLERTISKAISVLSPEGRGRLAFPLQATPILLEKNFISETEAREINEMRKIRNEVVHGVRNHNEILKLDMIERLRTLTAELEQRLGYVQ